MTLGATIVLLISLLGSLVTDAAAEALPANSSQHLVSPATLINADGSLSPPADLNGSLDLSGWDVRLDPKLGPLLQPAAATFGAWSSLGGANTGLNLRVRAIAIDSGVIYAGGNFTDAGGVAEADYIAKFTGGTWSSLRGGGIGLNDLVRTIAIDGGVIYAGGDFTNAGGDDDADRIAKFSGGTWSSLGGAGTGLNARVYAITIESGVIYAGGDFTTAGGTAIRIAKFSGGVWSSLGGVNPSLNSTVGAIAIDGGVIYAGGWFTDAGGVDDADRIAKFSGGAWSSLGGANTGLNSTVLAIVIDGGVIYAGGSFQDAGGDVNADRIAKFSGGAWSSLGAGLSNDVWKIAIDGGVIYAGGEFIDAGGDDDADKIAKFSGGAWSSLGGANTGLNGLVYAIAIDSGVMYAGGDFTAAGGDANADYIAQFGLEAPAAPTTTTPTRGGGIQRTSINNTGGTFRFGRSLVILPVGIIPSGYSNCRLVVTRGDSNTASGFSTGDDVYDVSIQCDQGNLTNLTQPITVCFRPEDGITSNKQVFQQHTPGSAYTALPLVSGSEGYVCGSTNQLSNFTVDKLTLPGTGFAPNQVTELASQSEGLTYSATALTLEIPKLGVELPIVGVPLTAGGWDTSWLSGQVGYLQTTAFPTFAGNTVLTSHVWDADNSPGPFTRLKELQHGDEFSIHAWGLEYTYEVRTSRLVSDWNLSVLAHKDHDWVTLLTCEVFNEVSGEYRYRRAVQAVLVSVD